MVSRRLWTYVLLGLGSVLGSADPACAQEAPPGAEAPDAPDAEAVPEDDPESSPLGPSNPSAALSRGMAQYDAGQFAECAQTFEGLLEEEVPPGLGRRQVERSRVYYAACLVAIGEGDAADEQFRAAIRKNPQMAIPSTVLFPQEVVDRFLIVRAALHDEITRAQRAAARRGAARAARQRAKAEAERRRIQELERLAFQERIVTRNERWIAWVPMGVGQFQNRDYALGGFFLATETLFLGAGVGAMLVELSLHSQTDGGRLIDPGEEESLNRNIDVARKVSQVSAGGLLLTAAVGILEANLSFVSEFDEGTRPRPPGQKRISEPPPSLSPRVVSYEGGAGLGFGGRF